MCVVLTGCASTPPQSSETAPPAAPTPAELPSPDERIDTTPFVGYALTALPKQTGRPIWVEAKKASYRFNDNGGFKVADDQMGPSQGSDDKAACLKDGAPFNDTTVDFPYTGIFVRGGELVRVTSAHGVSLPLKTLSKDPDDGTSVYSGDGNAGEEEFGWAPCIAGRAADSVGHRLDSYLPRTASIQVRRKRDGRLITFRMADAATPWLLLRYRSGAMIPSPYRMVEAGFDLERGLAVFSYRSVLDDTQSIRKIESRAVLPASLGGAASEGETSAQFALRTRLLLENLDACPMPALRGAEPCANPTRTFDRRALNATFSP